MAEVQRTTNAGEMAQRFVEFVMMHAQNAALFLGQIPHPQSGEAEVNLELARMFIDQLVMIQEKTRGNLNSEESTVLRNAISNLQLAYVEAARGESTVASSPEPAQEQPSTSDAPEPPPVEISSQVPPAPSAPPAAGEGESRKKFTKSYGA